MDMDNQQGWSIALLRKGRSKERINTLAIYTQIAYPLTWSYRKSFLSDRIQSCEAFQIDIGACIPIDDLTEPDIVRMLLIGMGGSKTT